MSAISNGLANGDSMDHGSDDGFMVLMEGGGPWGFSLQGGADFRSPLKISRVSSHTYTYMHKARSLLSRRVLSYTIDFDVLLCSVHSAAAHLLCIYMYL